MFECGRTRVSTANAQACVGSGSARQIVTGAAADFLQPSKGHPSVEGANFFFVPQPLRLRRRKAA